MTRSAALTASTALLGAILTAGGAMAQTRVIDARGAWTAYRGTSEDGAPVCGLRAIGGERQIHFKYFHGDSHLTVQAFKESWAVPEGVPVAVQMGIDGQFRWDAQAMGRGTFIEWKIRSDVLPDFEPAFRAGLTMQLAFPEGSETGWRANLWGSNAILRAFVSCMGSINSTAAPPSSQPHTSAPTQPFSAPTQPIVSSEAPKQTVNRAEFAGGSNR